MVEIRFAKPKSIPVVTAICPRRLNLHMKLESMLVMGMVAEVTIYQPVIQAKKGASC